MTLRATALCQSVRQVQAKRIAIVGGGPAGLTAAYYLAQLGHEVTVFDMMEKWAVCSDTVFLSTVA